MAGWVHEAIQWFRGHHTFSEYTAGAPRGLKTSRLGPAYVCSRLAP